MNIFGIYSLSRVDKNNGWLSLIFSDQRIRLFIVCIKLLIYMFEQKVFDDRVYDDGQQIGGYFLCFFCEELLEQNGWSVWVDLVLIGDVFVVVDYIQ